MKRIITIETRDLEKSVETGGCGECQTSCAVGLQDFLRSRQSAVRKERGRQQIADDQ